MLKMLLIQRNLRMHAPQMIDSFVLCNNSEIRPCLLSVGKIYFFKIIGDIKKNILDNVLCVR